MNIQLSVVIITFNEERNIERCLQSVQSIADEIIVIDSFSTDKTAEICQKYGVIFIKNPFDGHIEQKNFAISQATFSHILSLDADEVLSPTAIQDIQQIKQNFEADAYSLHRLNNFCGTWVKHSGWYPDRKIRLFKKESGSWQGQNPHDCYTVLEGKKVINIPCDILHYTVNNLQEHSKQINYFTDIAAMALYKKGKKSSLLKIIISPFVKFIKDYFIRLGFLDGFAGFVIGINSAHATFLKYSKLYLLQKQQPIE